MRAFLAALGLAAGITAALYAFLANYVLVTVFLAALALLYPIFLYYFDVSLRLLRLGSALVFAALVVPLQAPQRSDIESFISAIESANGQWSTSAAIHLLATALRLWYPGDLSASMIMMRALWLAVAITILWMYFQLSRAPQQVPAPATRRQTWVRVLRRSFVRPFKTHAQGNAILRALFGPSDWRAIVPLTLIVSLLFAFGGAADVVLFRTMPPSTAHLRQPEGLLGSVFWWSLIAAAFIGLVRVGWTFATIDNALKAASAQVAASISTQYQANCAKQDRLLCVMLVTVIAASLGVFDAFVAADNGWNFLTFPHELARISHEH